MKKFQVATFTVALLLAATVYTLAQVSISYNFSPNTTIRSSEVNSNFSTLANNALNRTGGTITGNITVDSGVTVDGLDLSAAITNKASTATISGAWTFSTNPTFASGLALTSPAITTPVFTGTTSLNSIVYTWPASQTADYILKTNGSGTLSWTIGNTTKGFFWGHSSAGLTADAYLGPSGSNATEVSIGQRSPVTGVIRNFYANSDGPAGSGQNFAYTVYVNGSPTVLTCVAADPATGCADTTHSTAVTAGQLLSVQADLSGSPSTRAHAASFEIATQ